MRLTRFALVPRDGLFLKDGRGWYTSAVGRGHGQLWPQPSTVLGALRAAWGERHMERTGRFLPREAWPGVVEGVRLKRLLALRRPAHSRSFSPAHRLWPAPADALHVRQGQAFRVHPLALQEPHQDLTTLGPGDTPGLDSLLLPCGPSSGKAAQPPLFWTEEELSGWLREPAARTVQGRAPSRRLDFHVTLQPETLAAEPSRMFASEVVETLDCEHEIYGEWALGVECVLPEEAADFPSGALGLGGRRRLARVEPLSEQEGSTLFSPPELPGGCRGLRLVLATPAEFEQGWLPDGLEARQEEERTCWVGKLPGCLEEVVLRAALVPRPLHLSTWDMARREPRPTRRLVPAGAVYFFEKRSGQPFSGEELREAWLAPWGRQSGEALGLVLPGQWTPRSLGGSGQ